MRDDLTAAKEELGKLPDLIKAGDQEQVDAAAARALELTTQAKETVHGPLWPIAENVPVVGVNVAAVKGATEATHIIVRDALPTGMKLLALLTPENIKVEGGGINLDPFREAQGALQPLAGTIAEAQSHIVDIDRSALLPFVDEALAELLDLMEVAGPLIDEAERYLPVLLQLAGADGPRTYVVVFQNNAEIRATGGNAANSVVLTVDNGVMSTLEDSDVEEFIWVGAEGYARGELPEETEPLYEADTVNRSQNFTRTPDFPTTASLFRQLWKQTTGGKLDGVISVDPVLLSYLLTATGPISLEDGSELNADNAVKILLSDAYERFGLDSRSATAYFADVSSRVFDAVKSGNWEPLEMLKQLQHAAKEQRLYMNFTNEEEQTIVRELNLDGALTADNTQVTQIGVYLNNAEYSKLQYYLNTSATLTCNSAERTVTTVYTVTSTVPGPNLGGYTLGWRNNQLGLQRTTMVLDVIASAPPGSEIVEMDPETSDLGGGWDRSGIELGHPTRSVTLTLPRGKTKTVTSTIKLPEGDLAPLEFRYSPTVTQTPVTIDASCNGFLDLPEDVDLFAGLGSE